ncbi:hypothetical protein [Moraxella lacunata]
MVSHQMSVSRETKGCDNISDKKSLIFKLFCFIWAFLFITP